MSEQGLYDMLYQEVGLNKSFKLRTLEDFVSSMIAKGRSLNIILAVASATRWHSNKDKIKETVSCTNK